MWQLKQEIFYAALANGHGLIRSIWFARNMSTPAERDSLGWAERIRREVDAYKRMRVSQRAR